MRALREAAAEAVGERTIATAAEAEAEREGDIIREVAVAAFAAATTLVEFIVTTLLLKERVDAQGVKEE